MIVAKISGGLGNQMFQYANAFALAKKLHQTLYLDTSTFSKTIPNVAPRVFELNIFPNIQNKFVTHYQTSGFYQHGRIDNKLERLFGKAAKSVYTEKKHGYNEDVNQVKPPVLMDGYFQSEKYFEDYSDLIRNQFKFQELDNDIVNISVLKNIKDSTSVAVHVRRGDYVKYAPTNAFHGVCSKEYYNRAIQYFIEHLPGSHFYFFSDEPDWVAENLLQADMNVNIIKNNNGASSWKDMYLMSQCKHNIIANSSFSWWGAWLNNNQSKKIIAPARWFQVDDPFYEPNDIVPKNWIRLS